MNFFQVKNQDKTTRARTGVIQTDHGLIQTPCFMPVGTQAVVKTLDQRDLTELKAPIILGNTYHLHLRPGEKLIKRLGGLHKFMNWSGPILTDSGGFQVFSLGLQKTKKPNPNQKPSKPLVKIDDNGVDFRSHIDGSLRRFTPESAIKIQHDLGADIIMAFDECTPDNADQKYAAQAMERTHRWAVQSLAAHKKLQTRQKNNQYLFGIIQGANNSELRKKSAQYICSLDFDGIAIGGESIGYNMTATEKILDWVYPYLPAEKPHYAMGLGLNPLDLFAVVERGIDMFDCVAPSRLARHGMLFVQGADKHRININNSGFTRDVRPIDKNCACSTCQNYSRAYLHHLFKAQEMTAMRLATIHNLHFYIDLMDQIRQAIGNGSFSRLMKKWR
ncbi:MAG: tRNA guanosine(34) transglycosylase Tgt [Candidatus Magasanikbacteria bacterium CG10_big_fil_rev_8_21_14_0_10_40_10]|uniref:Queuine tRNA-ribosyltransferase n=1 Tax=Candidatus Magasanikbacteria bacterium CG10_big_fil_rev_8_21_14_0_10_40_10 TaxID=1974648 RepID=A0A2M6W3R2_9BACT|nr:MAG: tRNA guanosine(34) transglycosylase Tgt [Candidatus Magasanikbacteria bacterium CG10_big_fil_rev_8_21_14_0_10_40_10]